jgi:hypothetical protein
MTLQIYSLGDLRSARESPYVILAARVFAPAPAGEVICRVQTEKAEDDVANESLEGKVFDVPAEFQKTALVSSFEQYQEMYRRSIEDSDAFWAEQAEERLHWYKKWDKVQDHDFANGKIAWFQGGKLNVSYNCVDRHVEAGKGDRVAYYRIQPGPSPMPSFSMMSRGSPTSSKARASRRVTGSSSTCR